MADDVAGTFRRNQRRLGGPQHQAIGRGAEFFESASRLFCGQSPQREQQSPSKPPRTLTDNFGEWCMKEANDAQQKRDLCEGWVADVLRRLLTNEANAAKRASRKPTEWLAWMETYYGRHERLAVDALRPVLSKVLQANVILGDDDFNVDPNPIRPSVADQLIASAVNDLVTSHVAESRRQLSGLYDTVNKDEFPAAVAACVDTWPTERSEADAKVWVNERSHLGHEVMTG